MTALLKQKIFWSNRWVVANLILLLPVMIHSACRDIRWEETQYTVDLRNRIVGSRLQKDGRLPYFFHWEDKGELRYADPTSRGSAGFNAITATPFFHELLMPLCDFQEKHLVRFWLAFSWLALLAATAMAITMAGNNLNKLMLVNLAVLFTLTEGWKMHIAVGQLYLFVALLMTGVIRLLVRGKKADWILTGLLAAALILCRPIALVIILPLLPRIKIHRSTIVATMLFLFVYGVFVWARPFERAVWTEYREALRAHVTYHQSAPYALNRYIRPDRKLGILEGVNFSLHDYPPPAGGDFFFTENGNVFQFYEMFFHRHMPLWLLNGLLLGSLLTLEIIWIRKCRYVSPPGWEFAVLAWTFYMIVEIFSPVHRNQYNTVEWLPVILTLTAFLDFRRLSPAVLLLFAGLVLNISNTHLLPMRHSIGEFCWLGAGLSVLLVDTKKPETWKQL